jgi:hypothetical protein
MKDAIMGKLYLCMAWAMTLCLSCQTSATIVTFNDLPTDHVISGDTIDGILWDYSSEPGIFFSPGSWITHGYNPSGSTPGNNYLTNNNGCTKISFQFTEETFPDGATVFGAYFAGYGNENNWPAAITVSGLWEEAEAWSVSLDGFTADLQWLAMDGSKPIDKVVISVTSKAPFNPTFNKYGYFGMDNLSFEEVIIPEPATLLLLTLGVAFIRRR